MALGEVGKEEIDSVAQGVFGGIEIQGRASIHKGRKLEGRMGEVVGRNWKARMIRPVEHGEVEISTKEEREVRESDGKEFRQTVKQFFIQVRRASTGDIYTRNNVREEVGRGDTKSNTIKRKARGGEDEFSGE